MASERKEYLGDAVYASFDGFYIWLETSSGIAVTNRIALEPEVFRNLLDYERKLSAAKSSLDDDQ